MPMDIPGKRVQATPLLRQIPQHRLHRPRPVKAAQAVVRIALLHPDHPESGEKEQPHPEDALARLPINISICKPYGRRSCVNQLMFPLTGTSKLHPLH